MKKQRGMAMSSLMMGAVLIFLGAILAMKVAPAWIEYAKVKKAITSIAQNPEFADASVQAIQVAYVKRAEIDNMTAVSYNDLEITKEGAALVISFAYTQKIPLFGNASLVFDFEGSSKGKAGSE